MFDITSGPGDAGHGSFGSPDNSNGYRHGRLRGDDFGLTARPSLLGLARTYLETQARLWPELAGMPAVPTITDAAVEAMADDFIIRRAKTGHSSAPKTGHHVGGTGWKDRLIRSCWPRGMIRS